MTITPATGYEIDMLSVHGYNQTPSGVTYPYEYTFSAVGESYSVTITFAKIIYNIGTPAAADKGVITLPEGYGYETSGGTDYLQLPYHEDVIYTFTPDEHCHIASVSVKLADGEYAQIVSGQTIPAEGPGLWSYTETGGIGYLSLTDVAENRSVAVTFADDVYTVTSSVDAGNGTVSPPGSVTRTFGGNVTYAIGAASGYKLSHIIINGVSVSIEGIETVYTLNNISEDTEIKFGFEVK
jgi:hypothetical protein